MNDKEALTDYIQQLYGNKANWALIMKQLKEYEKDKDYTYSGMKRTLQYVYEIKKMSIDDSNGGIGIIPFQYQEAYEYFYDIWVKKENIKNSLSPKILHPEEVIIKIKEPQLKPKKRKIFTFLDEEVEDGK